MKLFDIKIDDCIQGEKFIILANNKNILYSNTQHVNKIFESPPKDKFILISHNSDCIITDYPKYYKDDNKNADITLMSDNLFRWFGQNVGVYHEKIESIPIGLENSQWMPYVQKKKKIFEKQKESKNIKNLLYINHDINTNTVERQPPYFIFANKIYATIEYAHTQSDGVRDFDNYLDNIHSHEFVLAPVGGGFESHRLWECLYVGTIPVVRRCVNYSFYEDLPICFVDDWEEITEDFLQKELFRIKNIEWNYEKLSFSYWKNRILNTYKLMIES